MTTTGLLQIRPERRADLLIGPAVLRGPVEVHPVKDPVGGGRYELRAKEHFVLTRLDGTRTLAEVGEEYAARFRVRLGEDNWQQLLRVLYGRGLLETGRPSAAPAPAAPREDAGRPSTILAGRTRMVADADALIARLERRTAFARNRAVRLAVAALVTGMLVDLACHASLLVSDLRDLFRIPALLLAAGVMLWISLGVHELAHGLVGRAFGGTVTEIGLRWRLPMTYLYCGVRDVAFFSRRRHQVATAAAGPAANLVFLLPFWPVWTLLPKDDPGHHATGSLLLLGVATAAGNLVPLPPLDGYKLLGYGLGTARLATDSRRFTRLALAAAAGRGEGVAAYPRRARIVYGIYGPLSLLLPAAVAAAVLWASGQWLAGRFGTAAGFAPAIVVVMALVLWRMGVSARARRAGTARLRSAE
jgi:putative peptide zinc metalloprotease protein